MSFSLRFEKNWESFNWGFRLRTPRVRRNGRLWHGGEQHYRGWPDTKLPALQGQTPRQAVRTAKGRATVSLILKDIENCEDRKRLAGESFYDVAELRAELGLDS